MKKILHFLQSADINLLDNKMIPLKAWPNIDLVKRHQLNLSSICKSMTQIIVNNNYEFDENIDYYAMYLFKKNFSVIAQYFIHNNIFEIASDIDNFIFLRNCWNISIFFKRINKWKLLF